MCFKLKSETRVITDKSYEISCSEIDEMRGGGGDPCAQPDLNKLYNGIEQMHSVLLLCAILC